MGALGAYAVEDILHREADDARLGGRAGHRVCFARVGLPRVVWWTKEIRRIRGARDGERRMMRRGDLSGK